jgi:PhzF family phenazine biosynthesis protein
MKFPYYQVDAFTNEVFSGNPAGVCLLNQWIDDSIMLAIAAENKHSETAFIVEKGGKYFLRWFTPMMEVDLCGHATLASGFVIFNYFDRSLENIRFETKSGILTVHKEDDLLTMDFPSRKALPSRIPKHLIEGVGARPKEIFRAPRDYLAVFEFEKQIRLIQPNFEELKKIDCMGIIVTAPGLDSDFVSRFFGPSAGVPEDPVTGSAYCTLIPYWAQRLCKTKLHAFQVSKRGGEVFCKDFGDRVSISGAAVTYLEGTIHI